MKTIEVVISPSGGIEIESKGFSGAECERATKELERALGKTTADKKTEEFYRGPVLKQQAR